MEKVIVLVGSTGNGKSTLGSFLHDPIEYEKNPVFLRAKSVHPQTSKIQAETKDGFTIVDTPGLNENCKGDLEHTVEILDYFKSLQNVSAIVFCFNLANNRIDTEFYKTVEFYSELFRICMKQNVLIVLTGVCLDEVSAWKRNNDNLDIQEICTSLALEISKFVGLDYVPTAISIDAYPSTTSQEEYQEALKSRNLILNTISEMPVINIQKTLFCKTQQMKWMDTLEIAVSVVYNFKT